MGRVCGGVSEQRWRTCCWHTCAAPCRGGPEQSCSPWGCPPPEDSQRSGCQQRKHGESASMMARTSPHSQPDCYTAEQILTHTHKQTYTQTHVQPWLQLSSAAQSSRGKNNLDYRTGGCFLVWAESPTTHVHMHTHIQTQSATFGCVKQLHCSTCFSSLPGLHFPASLCSSCKAEV